MGYCCEFFKGHVRAGIFEIRGSRVIDTIDEQRLKRCPFCGDKDMLGTKEEVWSFGVSGDILIDVEEIRETLTREKPLAIIRFKEKDIREVTRKDKEGKEYHVDEEFTKTYCAFVIHDSILWKANVLKRTEELEAFISTTDTPVLWHRQDKSDVIGEFRALLQSIRAARLPNDLREPKEITVETLSI